MKQPLPASFIAYVKYLLSTSPVSTRELSKKIGKSSAYISTLLGGQIKSIEYETAYEIIKILVPNMSGINPWLVETFSIKPDSLIQAELEKAELEFEHGIEVIKEGQELVDDIGKLMKDKLIRGEIQFESIEILKKIAEKDLSWFGSIVDIQEQRPKEYELLCIFVDELMRSTDGMFGDCYDNMKLSESEKEYRDNVRKLINGGAKWIK